MDLSELEMSDPGGDAGKPVGSARFPRALGSYLLLERLASGGMGAVYLAKHGGIAGIEKVCVVKTLRPHFTGDREYTARFVDEARVMVQLSQRNICTVFDVGRIGFTYYLAMDYIAGRDLRTILERLDEHHAQFGEALGLHCGMEILAALDYAHRHKDPTTQAPLGIVHRDVSPQNVMVSVEGDVKLIDFGLAATTMREQRTGPNSVMGKVAYMAPEQARGDPVDGRADQFAAAIVIYELITSSRFYEDKSTHEIWARSGFGDHRPAGLQTLHPDLKAILQRALSPDPADRFADCEAFRGALDAYVFARGLRAGPSDLRALVLRMFTDEIDEVTRVLQRFQDVSPELLLVSEAEGFESIETIATTRPLGPGAQSTSEELMAAEETGPTPSGPYRMPPAQTEVVPRHRGVTEASPGRAPLVLRVAAVVAVAVVLVGIGVVGARAFAPSPRDRHRPSSRAMASSSVESPGHAREADRVEAAAAQTVRKPAPKPAPKPAAKPAELPGAGRPTGAKSPPSTKKPRRRPNRAKPRRATRVKTAPLKTVQDKVRFLKSCKARCAKSMVHQSRLLSGMTPADLVRFKRDLNRCVRTCRK